LARREPFVYKRYTDSNYDSTLPLKYSQEPFERTQSHLFLNAETNIAKACVTYFSFDILRTGSGKMDDEFGKNCSQINSLSSPHGTVGTNVAKLWRRSWSLHSKPLTSEQSVGADVVENEKWKSLK
jgi:hypothetical protein